jgi:photosystem II stability/assembly factor-like uncharacterized protein
VTVLLAIGLLGAAFAAIAWAAEPLLRTAEDTALLPEGPPGQDPVAEATASIGVLEQDLLEGAIAPEDFAGQRAEISYGAAGVLAAAEQREARLDAAIERRVALLAGTAPPAPSPPTATSEQEAAGGSRGRVWLAGAITAVVVFVGALAALVAISNSAARQSPVAELALADYRALASARASSAELILLHSGGLLRSDDAGRTWVDGAVPVDITTAAATADGFLVAGDGMVSMGPGGVFAIDTADAGMTTPLLALATDPAAPRRAIAIDLAGGIFASDDGGQTWRRLPETAPPTTTAVAVMRDQGLFLVATLDQGLLAGDGIDGWAGANGFVSGALPTVRIHDVGYDPDSGDTYEDPSGRRYRGALYVATDLGLFKSVDAGGSWRALALTGEIAALDVAVGEPAAITVVDARGRVYRSLDGGVTWPESE